MDGITLWNVPASEMRDLTAEKPEDLSFVPGHEGLRRLAVLLRREMPRDFTWDFSTVCREVTGRFPWSASCGTAGCAIGLARICWPNFPTARLRSINMLANGDQAIEAAALGMDIDNYRRIFGIGQGEETWIYSNEGHEEVAPAEVADAIDRYLATGSAAPRR